MKTENFKIETERITIDMMNEIKDNGVSWVIYESDEYGLLFSANNKVWKIKNENVKCWYRTICTIECSDCTWGE